jgi:3-oxo-5-alpha-steroid 4-dehydrogenase 1
MVSSLLLSLDSVASWSWIILWIVSPITLVSSFFKTAPMGKMFAQHKSALFGPLLNPRLAWVLMESPNLIALPLFVMHRNVQVIGGVNAWLLGLYLFHYAYRSLVYPFRAKMAAPMQFVPFAMAWAWCCVNGILHASFFAQARIETSSWQLILGSVLFCWGWYTNFVCDNILMSLRKPGETGYK